jgi:hypothetical protein
VSCRLAATGTGASPRQGGGTAKSERHSGARQLPSAPRQQANQAFPSQSFGRCIQARPSECSSCSVPKSTGRDPRTICFRPLPGSVPAARVAHAHTPLLLRHGGCHRGRAFAASGLDAGAGRRHGVAAPAQVSCPRCGSSPPGVTHTGQARTADARGCSLAGGASPGPGACLPTPAVLPWPRWLTPPPPPALACARS